MRIEIEKVGTDPKTGARVTGKETKTVYPKELPPAEIDAAGESALKAAAEKQPGSKFEPFGTRVKKDGSPADGFFEAVVKAGDPPRELTVQGWFKQAPDGTRTISSHAPAFEKTWPELAPKDY